MKIIVNDGLKFVCDTDAEKYRARTLLTKEPGTIQWLHGLRAGDVFYDIGANVGCYSLYAARLVGGSGHVYAFEPHPANVASLLRNIDANGFTNMTVLPFVLGHRQEYTAFALGSIVAGTSHSRMAPHSPLMQWATSIDELTCAGLTMRPTAIKIDVDGDEPAIMAGAWWTLKSCQPRVQVESSPENRRQIAEKMCDCGYTLKDTHYTADCARQLHAGTEPDQVIGNAIFEMVS